jgi:hypothetical protein
MVSVRIKLNVLIFFACYSSDVKNFEYFIVLICSYTLARKFETGIEMI